MIGIIGAMDTEVDNIKAQVKGKTVSEVAGVEFVCGFIEDVQNARRARSMPLCALRL